jgi:hypothetical protein
MLVVQPPVKELVVVSYSAGMGGTFKSEGRVSAEEGVRMGMLYDLAYLKVRRPITSFGVVWEMGNGDREEREDRREREVKMVISHTLQCRIGMPLRLGPEFQSEACKELDIAFSQGEKVSH